MTETIESSIAAIAQPVGDINFCQEGTQAKLIPKDDITPMESIRISIMLAIAATGGVYFIDWIGYIKKYGLERHFEITK